MWDDCKWDDCMWDDCMWDGRMSCDGANALCDSVYHNQNSSGVAFICQPPAKQRSTGSHAGVWVAGLRTISEPFDTSCTAACYAAA
jgi:hypothetical protein